MYQLVTSVKTGGSLVSDARHAPPLRERAVGLVLAAISCVERWHDRASQRHLLARLTERELRDIGASRYDALQEWRKPFWRE